MASIVFKRGTKTQYSAITTPDTNTVYICTDTGEIYMGSTQLSSMTTPPLHASTHSSTGTDPITVGSTADLPIFTGTNGVLTTKSASDALSTLNGVTLDTTQTISGAKTFSAETAITGGTAGNANHPSLQTSAGIAIGTLTTTAWTGVASNRKCNSDSSNINTALFFVNSDGSAKFCHRRGNTSSLGNNDDAYMLYDATGFKVAYSGTKGSTASTEYTNVDSNNIDSVISSATSTQKSTIRTALGITDYITVLTDTTSTTTTIATLADKTDYRFGTLSSLTVTAYPSDTYWQSYISFTANSTSISVSLPSSTTWADGITPTWTAGKYYEISICNGGRATYRAWS